MYFIVPVTLSLYFAIQHCMGYVAGKTYEERKGNRERSKGLVDAFAFEHDARI